MAEEYGRVAITPRGDWSETKQYEAGDIVTYNKGSSYLAHTTPPVGTLPTNEGYYQVSALGGSLATADAPGVVKPDNVTLSVDEEDGTISVNTASQTGLGAVKGSDDITVESDGQLRVNTDFAQAVDLANIIAGEAIKEVFGKVAKSIAVTMGLNENALLKSILSNQYENNSNKIPTSALVYSLKQTTDTLNSNFDNYYTKLQVDGKLTGFTMLPDDTLGINIFPANVNEKAIYLCATKVNAPKTTMEKYVIEVYRDTDFIVQKWYSLWFDVVYYRRCNVTGGWVWGAFKTVDMTTL